MITIKKIVKPLEEDMQSMGIIDEVLDYKGFASEIVDFIVDNHKNTMKAPIQDIVQEYAKLDKKYNADSLYDAVLKELKKRRIRFNEDLDEKMDYGLKMRSFEKNREFNDPQNWIGMIEKAIKTKSERVRIKKQAEKADMEPSQVYMMMFRKAKLSFQDQKKYAKALFERGVAFNEYQFTDSRTWKFNTKESSGSIADMQWVGKGAIVK